MGRRSGPRRHPEPETLGAVRHARRRSNRARSMATSRRARRGCSTPPPITHPAEHISHEAIGYSLDWFAKTLQGGTPRPADDQIWFRKEIGTLIALIGFVVASARRFRRRCSKRRCSRICDCPRSPTAPCPEHAAASGRRWTAAFILSAFIPGADLLSGLRAGRHLRQAVRLSAAGHHQPDHGLGRHQRADHAGADAVCAEARQPRPASSGRRS